MKGNRFVVHTQRAICAAAAALGCMMLAATSASAQVSSNADRSVQRIAAANALLDRYRSSRSLDDLRAAESTLFSATDLSTIHQEDLVARRRAVTLGYAKIFRELESLADPAFDPSDHKNYPLICVSPPREPSGRQLGPCADPNDIQDSGTRAAYLAANEENAAKTKRMNTQSRVRILVDQMTDSFVRVLRRYRLRAPDDGAALDAILRQTGVSEARRATIDAAMMLPAR